MVLSLIAHWTKKFKYNIQNIKLTTTGGRINGIQSFIGRQSAVTKIAMICLGALTMLFLVSSAMKTGVMVREVFAVLIYTSVYGMVIRLGNHSFLSQLGGPIIGGILILFWLNSPNWIINNIIAIVLMLNALMFFPRISIKTLILFSLALFCYDMIAVYFMDIMVETATIALENNIPLLITIPKSLSLSEEGRIFALGLGDIVLPGILIKEEICRAKESALPRVMGLPLMPTVLFVGYVIGLFLAFLARLITQSPQPALVFIVPVMLILLFLAYYKTGTLKAIYT